MPWKSIVKVVKCDCTQNHKHKQTHNSYKLKEEVGKVCTNSISKQNSKNYFYYV